MWWAALVGAYNDPCYPFNPPLLKDFVAGILSFKTAPPWLFAPTRALFLVIFEHVHFYLLAHLWLYLWFTAPAPSRATPFLPQRREFEQDFGSDHTDHPAALMRQKLLAPPCAMTDQFLSRIDPVHQFRTIKTLSDPGLFASPSVRQEAKTKCRSALMAAASLVDTYQVDYHPTNKPTVYFSRDKRELPIVLDTGASFCITPNVDDFVGPIESCSTSELNGLNAKIAVVGQGTVEWKIQDLFGVVRSVKCRAYYVPAASVRLFSPQCYFQKEKRGSLFMDHARTRLTLHCGTILEFPFNEGSNLPLMLTNRHFNKPDKFVGLTFQDALTLADCEGLPALLTVVDEANSNLTPAQKELLYWHQRLGHADPQRIQMMLSQPANADNLQILRPTCQKASSCVTPLCAACQLAKQGRTTPGSWNTTLHPDQHHLSKDKLLPGSMVSIDQYMSATHGRLPHTRGKEAKSKKFVGGTLFVDHATQLIHHTHQVSLRVGETLKAKNSFEALAKEHGFDIQQYHADNAPFTAHDFVQDCTNKNQKIDYSGVGAHHQNGNSERSIRTVTQWARAMMLHQVIHWPAEADLQLWPFALDQAVFLWNNMPQTRTRLAPLELFTGTKFGSHKQLQRAHVWGCPVFVLDPMLQDGKKIPKWKPRARRGLYVGVSPRHSTTVGRVLHLVTGNVSDQYHCVYDDHFSTVSSAEGGVFDPDTFSATSWSRLLDTGHERHVDIDMDARGNPIPLPPLDEEWLSAAERHLRTQIRHQRRHHRVVWDATTIQRELPQPGLPPHPPPPQVVRENIDTGTDATGATTDAADAANDTDHVEEAEFGTNDHEDDSDDDNEIYKLRSGKEVRIGDNDGFRKTRSGRRVIPPDRLSANLAAEPPSYRKVGFPGENMEAYKCGRDPTQKVRAGKLNQKYLNSLDWDRAVNILKGGTLGAMWAELEQHTDQEHNSIEWMNPALFSVKANSDDNPTWNDAMGGENGEGYWQACIKEHETLLKRGVWEEVEKESWMNVLPSVWAFKCKRFPDGLVRKLKARFCAMGCCQKENVDYFETFAPVVNWQTVRIMLAMSMLFGLATKQVDYTAAFVHADIDRDPNWDKMSDEERRKSGVFIQGPRGFATPGKVLKLKKSLYGLKQSPRNFYNFLKAKLEFVGFTQSDSDQCLFISEKVVCLVYVDDTLLFAKDMKDIDDIIAALEAAGMELEVEDDVAGFLGVHIDRRDDGTIHLTQKGLIARIIQALNIGDLPSKRTPAELGCLGSDPEGDPPASTYSYPSVIGMLQYLQGHSRPDITFAVSQCARWTHNPKLSHEKALERIGRYLKGTKDMGLILRPAATADFEIDCYVDADFAGTWGFEHPQDPSCVKSRTGFVIFIMGTPVVWTSRLQTDIATSTMESEYNALSMAMRDVIPLRRLTKSIIQGLGGDDVKMTHVKTTVHEDNHGTLRLGTMEPGRMTPRSKHYGIKYHWFRGQLKPNETEMAPVASALQRADFLTKSLRLHMFEANRKLTLGW
jgi:hypothetical protein